MQGIPNDKDSLNTIYLTGYKLYENGKYSEAADVFRALTALDLKEKKHWIGLGAAYQMLKDYDRALQSYAYAALLDEDDPLPHFHAAECFLAQDRKKEGKHVLAIAKTVALSDKEKYNHILIRVDLLETILQKQEDNKNVR